MDPSIKVWDLPKEVMGGVEARLAQGLLIKVKGWGTDPALQWLLKPKQTQPPVIGVRAWLARGYSIPGGASQIGCGRAPASCVARCRTPLGVRV